MGKTAIARAVAKDAYENNFPSRRGTYYITDKKLIAVYDNNSLNRTDGFERRDQMYDKLISWANATRMPLVSKDHFGGDEKPNYTLALVFDAPESKQHETREQLLALLSEHVHA